MGGYNSPTYASLATVAYGITSSVSTIMKNVRRWWPPSAGRMIITVRHMGSASVVAAAEAAAARAEKQWNVMVMKLGTNRDFHTKEIVAKRN